MSLSRKFSAYELNRLQKFGVNPETIANHNIPVEYLTGYAEFYGKEFKVDKNTLIPRIETEKLIELAMDFVNSKKKWKKKLTFIDIGTGSGAVGITFANLLSKQNINFHGYLTDLYLEALEIAKLNLNTLLDKRNTKNITILKSRLLLEIPREVRFDVILANLPYIPTNRIETLSSSVKDYEPITALDGGEDGLKLILNLLEQAQYYIKKNGVIILEVDDMHTQEFVIKNYPELLQTFKINFIEDINQKNRYWVCRLKL